MWMADGRRRHEWKMAARIAAAAANSNPYRKRAAKEAQFDPYHEPAKPKTNYVMGSIHWLKVFLPRKPKKPPCQQQQSEPERPTSS